MATNKEMLDWAARTFTEVARNWDERAIRFLEEALELAQVEELPKDLVLRLVERVYDRPPGETVKEVGQVSMTLKLLAENRGLDPEALAQAEFKRCLSVPQEEWDRRHAAKAEQGLANLS